MIKKQWKQSKGLVILYVGDGKGKTTAAVGAAVRALGHGWRVCFLQFMKEEKWPSGERDFFRAMQSIGLSSEAFLSTGASAKVEAKEGGRSIGSIDVEVVGEGFVGIMGDRKARETHTNAALAGLARATELLTSNKYQLVIFDEILSAVDEGLLSEQQILDVMAKKPEEVTLIMTGHKSYSSIFAKADVVTEMKKLKHPFDEGFIAKKGIDY